MYEAAVPMMYHTIHLRLPGKTSENDKLLNQLESFTDPQFNLTRYTAKVVVSGTWYIAYDDLDSSIGHFDVVSPAVRMFNGLVTVCLGKMPHLRSFVWDAQISPTQRLVSALALRAELHCLQLRLATNGTPQPYFHPLLAFEPFPNLTSLNLVQVDKAEILSSISHVLTLAPQLSELRIWADVDSELSLAALFFSPPPRTKLRISTLDLRNFASLNVDPHVLWDYVDPTYLSDLTLDVVGSFKPNVHVDFWNKARLAGVTPQRLSTNVITINLASFLESYSGLRTMIIMSNGGPDPVEPLALVLRALASRHADTLRVLALHPPVLGGDNPEYLLSLRTLEAIVTTFHKLSELAILIDHLSTLNPVFSLPELHTLHVRLHNGDSSSSEWEDDDDQRWQLRGRISAAILGGDSPKMRYVAVDTGPVYLIERDPLRWRVITRHLGRVPDTEMFRDRLFDFLEDVYRVR